MVRELDPVEGAAVLPSQGPVVDGVNMTLRRAPPTSEILVNHHDVPRLYRRSHGHFFEPNTKTEGVSEARNELSLER